MRNDTSAHGGNPVRFDVSAGITSNSAEQSSPRRPRRRPGENRERLLAAGIAVFGTSGYHGAQTAAIAALAEVPQPHVYANFATKQELFLACAERVCERLESAVARRPSECDHRMHSDNAASRDAADNDDSMGDEPMNGAFLLQCIAASAEVKLQPALGALLLRLQRGVGEKRVLDLLSASARDILHKNRPPIER